MKLAIEIDGKMLEADFASANGSARLVSDGLTHEAQVSEPEPGLYIVIIEDRVYRCVLEKSAAGQVEIIIDGRRLSAVIHDKKKLRSGAGSASGAGGLATLVAPMPGKVVRIMLQPGDEVAAHQGVLIVEAMKMQNEVQSPKAGKVAELRVTEGQTVNAGETLAVIE